MKATNKFILFCLLFTSFLSLNYVRSSNTSTLAYFSDSESSTGNMLTAAIWGTEADSLIITDSYIWPNRSSTKPSLELDIEGIRNVTIDKIKVTWNNSQGDTKHIKKIMIDDSEFFSGNKFSGDIIDGINYLLEKNSSATIYFYFNSKVLGITKFDINITMVDGSVKNYTVVS